MEKEKISRFDLEAAFKALDEIDIPKVRGIRPNRMDLKEAVVRADRTSALIEDYYDLNDPEDMQDAGEDRAAEIAKAKLARIEKIVDLDAESEDDIQPSYVGKTIIQCPQCMTLFYKDPADIEPSEDDPSIVNVAEICQHCGNDSGYTLIGKVAEETPEEAAAEVPAEEPAESGEEPTEETSEEEPAEENTEENSEEEFNLEPIEIPEEESEEKEEKKESFNRPTGQALNETYGNTPSERLVKAVIKEYIKPEKQELVLNEINRVKTAWNNLTQDEKEDWYNSNGTIGFFFDGPDGVKWDDDVFNSDVDEQEIYDIYQDYFIDYACPIDEGETNESLNASKLQKDSAKKSDLASENTSKNLTLNENISSPDQIIKEWDVFDYYIYNWADCEVDTADLEDAFEAGLTGKAFDDNYWNSYFSGDDLDYIESIYGAGKNIFKNGLDAEIQEIRDCCESLTEGIFGAKAPKLEAPTNAPYTPQELFNALKKRYKLRDFEIKLAGNSGYDIYFDTPKMHYQTGVRFKTEKTLDKAIAFIAKQCRESLNNSKLQKDSAKNSELATKNASENLTLNEAVDSNEVIDTLNKAAKSKNGNVVIKGDEKKATSNIKQWAKDNGYNLVAIFGNDPDLDTQLFGVLAKDSKDSSKTVKHLDNKFIDNLNQPNSILLVKEFTHIKNTKVRNAVVDLMTQKRLPDGTKLSNLKLSVCILPDNEDTTISSSEASRFAFKLDLSKKDESLTERVSTYAKRPIYKYKVYGTDNNANVLEEVKGEFKADEVKKIKADMKAVMDKNPKVEHVFAEKIDENGKEIPLDHLTISRHGIDYYALDDEDFEDDDEIDEALTEAGASIPTLSQENISKLLTSFKNEPVSDAQTRADLAKLKAESLQTNYDLDFDDKSFNRVINEALKSQGKKFKATNCAFTPDGKHFVVEGLIKENQKISKTVFKCEFNKLTKNFRGINENFKPSIKFKLQIKDNTLLTESIK